MKDSYKKENLDDLKKLEKELEKKNFDLRVNRVYGHLENPLELRNTRRKIARVKTRITEIEQHIRQDNKEGGK